MEGLWETTRGAPMTLIAWPDMQAEANLFAIDVPILASGLSHAFLEWRDSGSQGSPAF